MATPVVLTTGARPIVPVESGGVPMTPVDTLGEPVTVVDTLGEPVVLINNDGTPAFLAYSAKTYLGGVAPFHWLDFVANRALYAGADVGNVTQATGYSFTRASDGYYQNADGTLTLFGSGALRRGDRGVLIEGSRTNLVLQSQTFNTTWGLLENATVSADATAAPDGTTTADKLIEGSGAISFGSRLTQTISFVSGTAYTFSLFVKQSERNWCRLTLPSAAFTSSVNVFFNAATGALGGVALGATAAVQTLANGWYRVSLTATATGTASAALDIRIAEADNDVAYTGDGTSGLFIWGAQLEAASFPSSYIPTVAAAATRASDVLSYTTSSFSEHGYWAEFENQNISGAPRIIGTRSSAATGLALTSATALVTFNGTTALTKTITSVANRICKGASFITASGRGVTADGLTPATDANTWTMPTSIEIGNDQANSQFFFGYIRRVAVFNFAPTSAQITAMTS
jgi:hypothetical protein